MDTIAAIATPPGEGGIGIVRLSGPSAVAVAAKIFRPYSGQGPQEQPSFSARTGRIVRALPGEPTVDEVLLLVMRAPKTYTREDMVEIQAHGGPVVLRSILELAVQAGARLSEPGEFTKRAFLSGRIDLMQAEAVLDLIHSRSEAARAFAAAQLGGALSEKVCATRQTLVEALSHLEAAIDFPDDLLEPRQALELAKALRLVHDDIGRLLESSALGFVAKRGLRAVIWGKPNVGKSSLMNALSRKNRVIVTPHPGTTRDVVEEEIEMAGFPLCLVDTAGVQETTDPIEKEGVARSRLAVLAADLVLHVVDVSRPMDPDEPALFKAAAGRPRVWVLNKSDLPGRLDPAEIHRLDPAAEIVRVSCLDPEGVRPLEEALAARFLSGRVPASGEPVISSVRQRDILDKFQADLGRACQALDEGLSAEFAAADLRRALAGLSELTGEITNDEVLDRLFSQFCIGK